MLILCFTESAITLCDGLEVDTKFATDCIIHILSNLLSSLDIHNRLTLPSFFSLYSPSMSGDKISTADSV
jgi:hypothetical protein